MELTESEYQEQVEHMHRRALLWRMAFPNHVALFVVRQRNPKSVVVCSLSAALAFELITANAAGVELLRFVTNKQQPEPTLSQVRQALDI